MKHLFSLLFLCLVLFSCEKTNEAPNDNLNQELSEHLDDLRDQPTSDGGDNVLEGQSEVEDTFTAVFGEEPSDEQKMAFPLRVIGYLADQICPDVECRLEAGGYPLIRMADSTWRNKAYQKVTPLYLAQFFLHRGSYDKQTHTWRLSFNHNGEAQVWLASPDFQNNSNWGAYETLEWSIHTKADGARWSEDFSVTITDALRLNDTPQGEVPRVGETWTRHEKDLSAYFMRSGAQYAEGCYYKTFPEIGRVYLSKEYYLPSVTEEADGTYSAVFRYVWEVENGKPDVQTLLAIAKDICTKKGEDGDLSFSQGNLWFQLEPRDNGWIFTTSSGDATETQSGIDIQEK